jgi:hypothetical protein
VKSISLAAVVLGAALSLGAACTRSIGDDCSTSVDCDPNGTRSCDLSQPGGYCTVVGCDEKSCPSGATCIRTFPVQFLTQPCNPQCEDVACQLGDCTEADPAKCLPPCPAACPNGQSDECAADELCLDVGVCARRSLEQRYCAKVCGGNDDCRGGYECRVAGTKGSMVLSATPGVTTNFCAPLTSP